MSSVKPLVFTVTRNDLLYNFASSFEELFRFSTFKDDTATISQGVRYQESMGYDFQSECSPFIEIVPLEKKLLEQLPFTPSEIEVNISIEDIALGIRELVFSIPLSQIDKLAKKVIQLNEFERLSFYRGFEIRCSLSRTKTLKNSEEIIWHKSQLLFSASYIVKASIDEALFEISWMTFTDDDDKRDVLMYVDWRSADVSGSLSTDCFHVVANNDLKDQFKRLENNPNFGPLCIRMVADQILREIVINCLTHCDFQTEPMAGSLHEKVQNLFEQNDCDFSALAKQVQGTQKLEKLEVFGEVAKIMQKINGVGTTLQNVKFGGYRTL